MHKLYPALSSGLTSSTSALDLLLVSVCVCVRVCVRVRVCVCARVRWCRGKRGVRQQSVITRVAKVSGRTQISIVEIFCLGSLLRNLEPQIVALLRQY
jgi:hypothetical protein